MAEQTARFTVTVRKAGRGLAIPVGRYVRPLGIKEGDEVEVVIRRKAF